MRPLEWSVNQSNFYKIYKKRKLGPRKRHTGGMCREKGPCGDTATRQLSTSQREGPNLRRNQTCRCLDLGSQLPKP